MTFTNDVAHGLVAKNLGPEAADEIKGLDFLTFPDLEQKTREEIQWLKKHKVVPETVVISGLVYEVESGKVRRVE